MNKYFYKYDSKVIGLNLTDWAKSSLICFLLICVVSTVSYGQTVTFDQTLFGFSGDPEDDGMVTIGAGAASLEGFNGEVQDNNVALVSPYLTANGFELTFNTTTTGFVTNGGIIAIGDNATVGAGLPFPNNGLLVRPDEDDNEDVTHEILFKLPLLSEGTGLYVTDYDGQESGTYLIITAIGAAGTSDIVLYSHDVDVDGADPTIPMDANPSPGALTNEETFFVGVLGGAGNLYTAIRIEHRSSAADRDNVLFDGFAWNGCDLNILTNYSDNCSGDDVNGYTADWNIGIEALGAPDTDISYQRNNEAVQTHTLTGTTDTLTIAGVPADGGLYDTITIWFTNDATCSDTIVVKRPVPCPANLGSNTGEICNSIGATDIAGTVWEDWNYDGTLENDAIGVQGIQVLAYSCDNTLVGTTYTDSDGNYQFTGLTPVENYRIEFTLPETVSCWACPTNAGVDNGTTVQFIQPGNCANLGVANSADYCQENPLIVTPCYVNGDQTSGVDALVGMDYNLTTPVQHIALDNQIGAAWGLAYQKQNQTLFVASVLRRHVGFGSAGIDGIYVIDYSTPGANGEGTLLPAIDLTSFGIDVGTDPRPSNLQPLPNNPNSPSHDENTYPEVGKIGLGDIDISEDGNTLYVMNLKDKEVVVLDVSDLSDIQLIQQISIPNPGCVNGELRPWALKFYRGELYVGMICDGENGGTADDLELFVKKLSNGSFIDIYQLTLNYTRNNDWYAGSGAAELTRYDVWGNTWLPNLYHRAQPLLGDIEFDIDGAMILTMLDRSSLRAGYQNYSPNTASTTTYSGRSRGDILRLCKIDGDFILESLTGCPPNFTGQANQTFGSGEYYNDNISQNPSDSTHPEGQMGGTAVFFGQNEVVSTALIDFNTAGFAIYNATTGSRDRQFTLIDLTSSSPSGKVSGLGDVELLCSSAPLEIGNLVWEDSNGNGIQDGCEQPLANIEVSLYDSDCNLLASILTGADGSYYFNSSVPGIDAILPNTDYYVVITDGQFNTDTKELLIGSQYYSLTYDNMGDKNLIDSDARVGNRLCYSQLPYVAVTTGEVGCALHNFDIGFRPIDCELVVHSIEPSNCSGSETNYTTDLEVEVSWSATPIGEDIQVVLNGGASQTISVSSGLTSPQTVTFSGIAADGNGTQEFVANFSTTIACTDTMAIKTPLPCPADVNNDCTSPTGIQGKAFDDFNYNGADDSGSNGVQSIEVQLYDCNESLVAATYTDADGDYQFSTANNGEQYRVEFVLSEAIACDYCFSNAGTNNGSSVQFVTAPTCANIGISVPGAYCETKPYLVTTCFVGIAPSYDNFDVMVGFPYNSGSPYGPGDNLPGPDHIAIDSQIGSTFGIAYHKATGSMLAASYFKWSTGYGPGGQDAIYNVNAGIDKIFGTADDNVSTFIEFDNLFGPYSTGYSPYSNSTHQWGDGSFVGKVSFGDIDFSNNRSELYVMNLGDRKVYTIPVSGDPLTYDADNIQISSTMPQGADCAGTMRPFAIEVSPTGKVFVGATCQQDSKNFYVWEYNPKSNTWSDTPAFETYIQGYTGWGSAWGKWGATNYQKGALFSGLEIDEDGNLIIALRDRKAETSRTRSGGDIFKACGDEINGWTLESNGVCGGQTGARPDVGQGPQGGEFFNDSSVDGSEVSIMGGLYYPRGTNEVIAGFDDPFRVYTGGMAWFDLDSGEKNNQYEVTDIIYPDVDNIDGKRAILGEIDGVCDANAPIEIGNYVWVDTNQDDIQGACELPISEVVVELIKDDIVIATTTTDTNGQYHFSDKNATDANLVWTGIDADTTLIANTAYILRITNAEGGSQQTVLNGYNLATTDANGNNSDNIDNDAALNGTSAEIAYTTGDYGCADHSLDFGFRAFCNINADGLANVVCTGTNAIMLELTPTGTSVNATYSVSVSGGGAITISPESGSYDIATTFTLNDNTGGSGDFTITIADENGCTRNVVVTDPGACNTATCNCTDYIYLNDVDGNGSGAVHKMAVAPGTGDLIEVMNDGNAWYPGSGVSELPLPHGLGVDLNGYLYIADHFRNADTNVPTIRRLKCDGTIFPEDDGNPATTNDFSITSSEYIFNINSHDGYIYSNGGGPSWDEYNIYRWDPCDGSAQGFVSFDSANLGYDWGFFIDENGAFYTTVGGPNSSIFKFTPTDADFTANTLFPPFLTADSGTFGLGASVTSGAILQGITTDNEGNIYVVEGNRDNSGQGSRIVKYSSEGVVLAIGPIDNDGTDGAGWDRSVSIVYSEVSNSLYTASMNPAEDCVTQWDTDLTTPIQAIGPVAGAQSKGMAILTECCPVTTPMVINEATCFDGVSQKVYLQDFIDCGSNKVICEGQWAETTSDPNLVFNQCDLSIDVIGVGCGTYTLSKGAQSGTEQCGAFEITVNICSTTQPNSDAPITTTGTCSAMTPNNDATASIANIVDADVAGISSAGAASYDGSNYDATALPIDLELVTANAVSFSNLEHNQSYIIRLFNMDNDCYVDMSATTEQINCDEPACSPIRCININISKNE